MFADICEEGEIYETQKLNLEEKTKVRKPEMFHESEQV